MAAGRIYAVLTGDIVDSSRRGQNSPGPISLLLQEVGGTVKRSFSDVVEGQIDVFRGDSWQMVLAQPPQAIRVGIFMRALLRSEHGIDSRVSIGFGEIDYLPQEKISTGSGQAFTLSGQGLEDNLKRARMAVFIPSLEGTLEGKGLNIITQLIDLQIGSWTQGQSRAAAGALMEMTQAEIAASWQPGPISQQGISQHLENAGWSQIKKALLYLEDVLQALFSEG